MGQILSLWLGLFAAACAVGFSYVAVLVCSGASPSRIVRSILAVLGCVFGVVIVAYVTSAIATMIAFVYYIMMLVSI